MNAKAEHGHKKAWGTEHMSTLDTVNNLDMLYADQGKMVEAEVMYMRALQGYENAVGENASNRWQFKCIMKLVSKQQTQRGHENRRTSRLRHHGEIHLRKPGMDTCPSNIDSNLIPFVGAETAWFGNSSGTSIAQVYTQDLR